MNAGTSHIYMGRLLRTLREGTRSPVKAYGEDVILIFLLLLWQLLRILSGHEAWNKYF